MTTTAYRSIVFPGEHRALIRTIASLTGREPDLQILGSERSPGSQPLESLVGYKADTATGPLEGVVTLRELDDGWVVSDYSYRFTDPPPGATAELEDLSRQLNAQLVERAGRLDAPPATGTEGATPSPR